MHSIRQRKWARRLARRKPLNWIYKEKKKPEQECKRNLGHNKHAHALSIPDEQEKTRGVIFEEIMIKNQNFLVWWKISTHIFKKLSEPQ